MKVKIRIILKWNTFIVRENDVVSVILGLIEADVEGVDLDVRVEHSSQHQTTNKLSNYVIKWDEIEFKRERKMKVRMRIIFKWIILNLRENDIVDVKGLIETDVKGVDLDVRVEHFSQRQTANNFMYLDRLSIERK